MSSILLATTNTFSSPVQTRYFALWGAGGGGGGMDTGNNRNGAAGGNGAFMEIKVEGIPSGMVFNMVCGDGGDGGIRNSAGGAGGGGGSASILRCQYEGQNVLLAVAGAGGGGGGGGGGSTISGRSPSSGGGASSTSSKQGDALDLTYMNIRGGHTAGTSSSPSMSNHGSAQTRLDPPTRETYAQDGGVGARSDNGFDNFTPLANGPAGGSLPTASWGGQGGTAGGGNSSEGGGGGGGGGYYGGCGAQGGTNNNTSGAGGGGGSSYVRSGSVSVGGASLTVTLLQENQGSHPNLRDNTSHTNTDNPSVTLEYGTSGFTTVGRGGIGGLNNASGVQQNAPAAGSKGRIQIHSDTALIQANTTGGTQANVTVTI